MKQVLVCATVFVFLLGVWMGCTGSEFNNFAMLHEGNLKLMSLNVETGEIGEQKVVSLTGEKAYDVMFCSDRSGDVLVYRSDGGGCKRIDLFDNAGNYKKTLCRSTNYNCASFVSDGQYSFDDNIVYLNGKSLYSMSVDYRYDSPCFANGLFYRIEFQNSMRPGPKLISVLDLNSFSDMVLYSHQPKNESAIGDLKVYGGELYFCVIAGNPASMQVCQLKSSKINYLMEDKYAHDQWSYNKYCALSVYPIDDKKYTNCREYSNNDRGLWLYNFDEKVLKKCYFTNKKHEIKIEKNKRYAFDLY